MAVDLKKSEEAVPLIATRRRRYRFVDYATQGYLGVVALIVLVLHGDRFPAWPVLVGIHVAVMVAAHLLILVHSRMPDNLWLTFARSFYPLLLIIWLYQETGMVNLLITGGYHDHLFIALEERIFGYQPIVRFMEALPYRGVAEVLYFSYFSYYSLVAGVGFALFAVDRERCLRYVSVVSFVFFVCYLLFIIAPVLGPKAILIPRYAQAVGIVYHVPPVPPGVESAFFYHIMSVIHSSMQVIGAAFPSSHVAVSLTSLYFAWISFQRGRYVILVMVSLLCLSTVYCRYHYAVDVFGGIIVAAGLIPFGEWLYRRDGRRPRISQRRG